MTYEELLRPLAPLMAALELEFVNIWTLREAFTHRSFLNEHPNLERLNNNQRLEFLGDAVIALGVKEYLFVHYPNLDEGEMAAVVTRLASNERFGEIGLKHRLGHYLLMSEGEKRSGLADQPKANADALEALIGAIYVDQGFRQARLYVDHLILKHLRQILKEEKDPIEILQLEMQAKYRVTPRYQDIALDGSAHEPEWIVAVYRGEQEMGRGKGPSKKKARQQAAINALNTHFPNRRKRS